MSGSTRSLRPFLRWPGGKQWLAEQLADEIMAMQPLAYHEPFVGAGAVALALPSTVDLHLSDWSEPLINLWQMVGRHPKVVASLLVEIIRKYGNEQEGYLSARALFNQYPPNGTRAAALMLYLNARSFNGLWRENKRGGYNVPWGQIRAPRIVTADELVDISERLRNATIRHSSFVDRIAGVGAGEAIYADPPYASIPGKKQKSYVAYTASGFTDEQQAQLASQLEAADARGVHVWATNSDTPLIRSLYSWADLTPLAEPRPIAASALARGDAHCLLIRSHRVIQVVAR